MPVISIIVPVYNVEPYLRRCVDSILVQTFADFECILVDDGSTDNCPTICDEYAEKDNRVIVIHQKNAGVSAARNTGLDVVCGEWIGFVDSDDWCDAEMFQVLYENAIKYGADVSICGIRVIRGDNAEKAECIQNELSIFNGEEAISKMFVPGCFGGFSFNKLVKRAFFSKYNFRYDIAIKYMEDVMLFYEVFKHIKKVVYSSTYYYNYFYNPQSVTTQCGLTEAAKTAFVALDRMISMEKCKKIQRDIKIGKIRFTYILYQWYVVHKNYNDEFYVLRKIIMQNIDVSLLDTYISLKQKIIRFIMLSPCLYYFCTALRVSNRDILKVEI